MLLVLAAFVALSSLGYGGLQSAAADYGYGYGYQYEYGEAHLIVIKHVVNDNGGSAVASDFTMTITGVTATGGNSFPGSELGTDKVVTHGSYGVTETGPSGYVTSFSADCSGSILGGQTKTCTVTNNDVAPVQTPGYWKNHPEVITSSSLLPQTLGSFTVSTLADVSAVLDAMNCSSSKGSDGVGCLAGQLLAAELNLAMGSSPCIAPTVAKANTFLSGGTVVVNGVTVTGVSYTGPSGTYSLTDAQRTATLALKDALDKYNSKGSCKNLP